MQAFATLQWQSIYICKINLINLLLIGRESTYHPEIQIVGVSGSMKTHHAEKKKNNTKKYPISVSETVGRRFQSRNKQEFMAALPVGQPMCSGTRLTIISMGVRHCLRGVLLNIKVALSEDAWEITSKSCHCFAERCSPFVLRAGFVFPLHCAADDKDCECALHHEPARCNLPLKDTNGHWA